MSDIANDLRAAAADSGMCGVDAGRTAYCAVSDLLDEAADEIERLRNVIVEKNKALQDCWRKQR